MQEWWNHTLAYVFIGIMGWIWVAGKLGRQMNRNDEIGKAARSGVASIIGRMLK
jgi:hypothetical protein